MHRTGIALIFITFALIAFGCSGGSSSSPRGVEENASDLNTRTLQEVWEANFLRFGELHCNAETIAEQSTWEGGVWYYDGLRVYLQAREYFQDPRWAECASFVRDVYRNYVLDNEGRVPGWRVFPHGLLLDYATSGSPASREAALLLARNSAFAARGGGESFELSRETAYLIHAYLTAEDLGAEAPLLNQAVNYSLGHLEQWRSSATYVKPFMVGLTFEALIHFFEKSADQRVLPEIQKTADWLWDNTWQENEQAFSYIYCRNSSAGGECNNPGASPAPDLNLLIAPAYAWLAAKTGESLHAQRAASIFEGGVRQAYLGGGKQFSQNYRWSIDFFRYLADSERLSSGDL